MPERTNPRHPSFDYRSVAAYFVTICARKRQCLFGTIRQGRMALNKCGRIVVEEWRRSGKMREEVVLDAFVVMPNHMHGIVCIVPPTVQEVTPRGYDLNVGRAPTSSRNTSNDDVGPHGDAALQEREGHLRWKEGCPQRYAKSLGSIIAGFKGAVTAKINRHRDTAGISVWQSRYHDRILRNEEEWRACRRYIEYNPGRWTEDRYHTYA